MTDSDGLSSRVSYEQLALMIDFMGLHVEFASGHLRTLEARHTSKRLWMELAKKLNNCRGGIKKSSVGWSKYWTIFKNRLKTKAWLLKRQKSGSSMKNVSPLTKMEKRALVILGPDFEKKFNKNGYDLQNNSPLEVKLESYQELNTNGFNRTNSESSDVLSGVDEQSNQSGDTSDEDCNGDNNSEPTTQNLYPKWLIEVEKKRAEAELIRANAEEVRAAAAAKNAEAALLQANAMKQLADATSLQAEAMLRIANVLERNQRDMLTI